MRIPSLRRHKPSGQAVVTLSGHDHYLGAWPALLRKPPPDVRAAYDRLIAEWIASGRRPLVKEAEPARRSVNELILAFWKHAETYYRREDGTATQELADYRLSLRPLRELYGTIPVDEFSPLKLKAVRQKMIDAGLVRRLINQRVGRIVRMFRWGVAEEMVPETVHRALDAVPNLQKGRCEAEESEPVKPVDDADVEAALPFLTPTVRAMVLVQRYTGMRPAEVCGMRACDIDRTGPVWLYRPHQHKTRYQGKVRVIAIGPKAQEILRPFFRVCCPHCGVKGLPVDVGWRGDVCGPCHDRREEGKPLPTPPSADGALDETYHLFNPRRSMADFRASQRAARKTRLQPSQVWRKKARPKKKPGERYSAKSYSKAVHKACVRAGVDWHAHQLRHSHATEVRKRYGLEAAQVALGHAQANVTEVYAERDLTLAVRVAREIG
jgi:integrase